MLKLFLVVFLLSHFSSLGFSQSDFEYPNTKRIEIEAGEKWWGGAINDGSQMPLQVGYSYDMYANLQGNQAQPLLLSNKGRVIWSDKPFKFSLDENSIIVESIDDVVVSPTKSNSAAPPNLQDAFRFAANTYFPADGKLPDMLLFERPQYNTWIELTYDQNQADILKYAHAIVDNGFPPGVLMIDDNWQQAYGRWRFRDDKFPAPKAMIEELHRLGFKVMVWVCPFVSPDTQTFRSGVKQKMFLRNPDGHLVLGSPGAEFNNVAMVGWWNGYSALLDFSNLAARKWFVSELQFLIDEYGVDGFKLDAGDACFYAGNLVSHQSRILPNDHSALFAQIGLDFPLNEYRATWKTAGKPLVQRLRDKRHNWEDLQTLIPNITAQGLMGYAFTCPDMIGGGEFKSFLNDATIDQELIVRSAQVHALMPMMQFSVAPWRILDEPHLAAVKNAVQLRQKFVPEILQLAQSAAKDGQPIVRNMEYVFPNAGYGQVRDQFFLGDAILVCPVLKKGQSERTVVLPAGRWKAFNGEVYQGDRRVKIDVQLNTLPYFQKVR